MTKWTTTAAVFLSASLPRTSFFGLGTGTLFVLVAVLVFFNSKLLGDPRRPTTGFKRFAWTYAVYCVVVLVTMVAVADRDLSDLRFALSVVAVLAALYAAPIGRSRTDSTTFDSLSLAFTLAAAFIVLRSGILLVQTGDIWALRSSEGGLGGALESNPNQTARIAIVIAAGSQFVIDAMTPNQTSTIGRFARYTPYAMTALIVLTLSRANIVAIVLFWAARALWSARTDRVKRIVVVLAVMSLAAGISGEQIAARFSAISEIEIEQASTLRERSWSASLGIVEDFPLAGVGISGEEEQMRIRGSFSESANRTVVTHGGFLKIAVYAGVPAAALLVASLIAGAFSARRKAVSKEVASRANASGVAFILALVPMNIGADGLGLALTWYVIALVVGYVGSSETAAIGPTPEAAAARL